MKAAYVPVRSRYYHEENGEEKKREEESDGVKGREREEEEMKRASTYFVVDCGPCDRLCSQSGTPRSMLSVQGQRTGRAKTRVGTQIRRVHSVQR